MIFYGDDESMPPATAMPASLSRSQPIHGAQSAPGGPSRRPASGPKPFACLPGCSAPKDSVAPFGEAVRPPGCLQAHRAVGEGEGDQVERQRIIILLYYYIIITLYYSYLAIIIIHHRAVGEGEGARVERQRIIILLLYYIIIILYHSYLAIIIIHHRAVGEGEGTRVERQRRLRRLRVVQGPAGPEIIKRKVRIII
jgi:hypothetical protein